MLGVTVPAFGLGMSPLGPRIFPRLATWCIMHELQNIKQIVKQNFNRFNCIP